MKFFVFIILTIFVALADASAKHIKTIYGDDNRRIISETSITEQQLARSVLAQVPLYKISTSSEASIGFDVLPVQNLLNLCPDEKFASDTMLSSCTGFLVAPDLLLTAGHCLKDKSDCQKNLWVLDYDQSQSVFNKEKIVYCKEIVNLNSAADFALVRLDRDLDDRTPLKIRQSGKLNSEAEFLVIGHPLGLPKISADQAFLRGNLQDNTFTISSDTYSGSSGSPVIDNKTSLVEGILIKGEKDFEMDFDNLCRRSTHCDFKSCAGETVLRSTTIPL
jgi:hypothetical protein